MEYYLDVDVAEDGVTYTYIECVCSSCGEVDGDCDCYGEEAGYEEFY